MVANLLGRFRQTIARPPDDAVRCALCGGRYTREPLNCPACGSATFVDDGH
ncbi:MAG: hypothetical protein ABEJ70_04955 [Halobacteriaceae archaeon]